VERRRAATIRQAFAAVTARVVPLDGDVVGIVGRCRRIYRVPVDVKYRRSQRRAEGRLNARRGT